jgi:hypothetical protein
MTSRLRSSLLAATVALLAGGAWLPLRCSHPVPVEGAGPDTGLAAAAAPVDSTVTLDVRNDNFSDVAVWVISFGQSRRLGVVTGNTSQTWALNPSVVRASDLRIIATPIGANGRANSGPIVVQPGQTIQFTVGTRLTNSVVSVH